MEYTYYPGCSLHSVNKQYDKSCKAVFERLDVKLNELEDWNCCGATFYMSVDEITSLSIAARNLALAEKFRNDLMAPCSSCFTVLNKTNTFLKRNEELRSNINSILHSIGLEYNLSIRVRHPLDILINDIGFEIIRSKVKHPLTGIKIANYYGCQIVRPEKGFDDRENPVTMDKLFEMLDADSVYFPAKVKCCGGMSMITAEDVALKLIFEILTSAAENEADIIVTTCPLCQMNLEAYQDKVNKKFKTNLRIPIYYFTQVLGIALGIDEETLGINNNFYISEKLREISQAPMLETIYDGPTDELKRRKIK